MQWSQEWYDFPRRLVKAPTRLGLRAFEVRENSREKANLGSGISRNSLPSNKLGEYSLLGFSLMLRQRENFLVIRRVGEGNLVTRGMVTREEDSDPSLLGGVIHSYTLPSSLG